ncbi:unnamed protein product, partial [Prorocentrum cordatum]
MSTRACSTAAPRARPGRGCRRRGGEPHRVAIGLARQGRWELALAAVVGPPAVADAAVVSAVVAGCGRARKWEVALWLAQDVPCPDVALYNAAVSAVGAGRQWERALCLLRGMRRRHLQPDAISFNALISSCSSSRRWAQAVALFWQLRTEQLEPSAVTHSACGSALLSARHWAAACRILRDLVGGGRADAAAFGVAVSASEKGHRWLEALRLAAEMRRAGLRPDVAVRNAAISACAKGRRWEHALCLLAEMLAEGVSPTCTTYNASISACERGHQWLQALRLLSQMRRGGLEHEEITYNATVSACAMGSSWRRAVGLLEEMSSGLLRPNVITFGALIRALEHAERWLQAVTCNSAVGACERAGMAALAGPAGRGLRQCVLHHFMEGTPIWGADSEGLVLALSSLRGAGAAGASEQRLRRRRLVEPAVGRLLAVSRLAQDGADAGGEWTSLACLETLGCAHSPPRGWGGKSRRPGDAERRPRGPPQPQGQRQWGVASSSSSS